jgi:hypothetical protein
MFWLRPILSVLLILVCSLVQAGHWEWTQRADYHNCAVQVRAGSAGGSGVWMKYGDVFGVLTAQHVVEGASSVTCTWPDGHKDSGKYTTCRLGNDVALVFVSHPTLDPLPFSTDAPQPGDVVELVGYGGPKGAMRHFCGKVLEAKTSGTNSGTAIDFCVMNGDSGSGILNNRHEVVAIQSVGLNQAVDRAGEWPIYGRSGSASYSSIKGFLDRAKQRFAGGGCGPGGCDIAGGSRGGGGYDDLYPPSNPTPPSRPPAKPDPHGPIGKPDPAPIVEVKPKPTPPPEIVVDYNKIAEAVIDKMKQDPDRFRGPPGKDGKDGSNAKVDEAAIADSIRQKLPPITVVYKGDNQSADPALHDRQASVRLGETLTIPAVRMELEHPGGQRYHQQKPLGEPIRLRLVPEVVVK